MRGWWQSPSGQSSDPRCAGLSLNGRGLLWSLCDAADGRGAVPLGSMTLDAVLLALSGRTPEAEVRAAWAEVSGVDLACVEGGVIVLDLPEPDVSRLETPTEPGAAAGGVTERAGGSVAASRLKAWFSKLRLKTAEARAGWLDGEQGRKTLDRLGVSREEAQAFVDAAGRRGGRFGREKDAVTRGGNPKPAVTSTGGNHGGNSVGSVTSAAEVTTEVTTVSPAPPSGERNTEREAESGARATEVTNGGNHGGNSTTPRCPTEERTFPDVEAREVFAHLRAAAKSGGGGLMLSFSMDHEKELNRILLGLSPAWTVADVKRLAHHIGAGHLREGWKPSLASLRGKDSAWTMLLSLRDESAGCDRCATAARNAPAARAAPVGMKSVSAEEIANFGRIARGQQ